jgi:DNA polymerase-3 subunit gamma/tau
MSESPDSQEAIDSSYTVVARRYRPRGFAELVGQDHVGRALKNAIETNRVGHAYLFTGARGVGKTSTARIFAKALNDPSGPTATPDSDNDIAKAIDAGEDVDVIEIDGASNRGIDEIRSLRANVGVRPSRSRFKIYIIDEVHMLTPPAFNALLKTLEEPPEHVKFIFCTTDPEKIPITVLSRCQRFDFAPVEVSKIVQRLREIVTAESAAAEDAALELVARRAAGSMRDSQSLLEQVLSFSDGTVTADHVHAMLGTADDERLHALAAAMANRDAASALEQMDAAIDAGVDAGRLAEQLLGYFRDLMAVTVGCDQSLMRHTSASLHRELKELGARWGLQTVLAVVGLIDQTLVRIRHSVYARVLLEATLIQICNLPDLQNIADLAAAADGVAGSAKPAEKKNVASPAASIGQPQPDRPPQPEKLHPPAPRPQLPSPVEPERSSTPAAPVAPEVEPPSAAGSTPTQSATAGPVASSAPLSESSVTSLWQRAADEVEPMTATLARSVQSVALKDANKLRVVFPADSKVTMRRIDLPEHKTALLAALARLSGRDLQLEFAAAPAPAAADKPPPRKPGKDRIQRMREIEGNPIVQACVELFDAEIVKVDQPRPG